MAGSLSEPADRDRLKRMLGDIEADEQALRAIIRRLDVPVRRRRIFAGRAAEKLGRLKPNGRLTKRSPLSDLVEIEALFGPEPSSALKRVHIGNMFISEIFGQKGTRADASARHPPRRRDLPWP